jgi:hypothetical protein
MLCFFLLKYFLTKTFCRGRSRLATKAEKVEFTFNVVATQDKSILIDFRKNNDVYASVKKIKKKVQKI